MAANIQPVPPRLGAERPCFARYLAACWMAALALTTGAVAASPAAAQSQREKTTNLMEEAQERLAEETAEAEKERLRHKIEYYRHSLGYHDQRGRKILWQVSYQKRLLKQLDGEIARMESMTKGGWGLASKSDDCKRAVRIMARNLLQRSDREDDQTERVRYGLAGMLLVHNADLIDALLAELLRIEVARQAKSDTRDRGATTLDRGLRAANSLTDMARRIGDGRMQMGYGELGRLAEDLQRIRQALDYARTGILPPLPPPTPGRPKRKPWLRSTRCGKGPFGSRNHRARFPACSSSTSTRPNSAFLSSASVRWPRCCWPGRGRPLRRPNRSGPARSAPGSTAS